MTMRVQPVLAVAFLPFLAAPAFADTVVCDAPYGNATIEIAIDFSAMRDSGVVSGVRMHGENFSLSTYAGETGFEPEVLAFADVSYDRITLGLESDSVMRMVLLIDIVRAAVHDASGGPDTDVVVAGVASIGGERTETLLCTGW